MLANQAAIRIGMASPEHADREQAREAIDALAGVVELLRRRRAEPDELEALRRDLAQLRMAFVQSGQAAAPPPAEEPAPEDEGPGEERPPIWTPRRRGLTGLKIPRTRRREGEWSDALHRGLHGRRRA